MPISRTQDLFSLIKSLSKADKRAFRVYAERTQPSDQLLYMQLFDVLDKLKEPDETVIKQKLNYKNQTTYSNTKRHLYEQLLVSLRLINKTKKQNIRIRELIDFSYLLYGKGLYLQSLKILEKAKKLAKNHRYEFMHITILEIEKMIHSRYITRTKGGDIDEILRESSALKVSMINRIELSDLRVILHKLYIERGHIHNKKEETDFKKLFKDRMPSLKYDDLGLMEKVHYCQSYVWYYFILYDFENCMKYAIQWVKAIDKDENIKARDANLLFRAYHYVLTSAYYVRDTKTHYKYLQELEDFRNSRYGGFNENTKILSFMYTHTSRMNHQILKNSYKKGVEEIPRTLRRLNRYKDKIDKHKVMILYFKMSWLYLRNDQAPLAIDYLNKIINISNRTLRVDLQLYARLMFLMAHFDLENFSLLKSLTSRYQNYFKKNSIDFESPQILFQFFREFVNLGLSDRKACIQKFIGKLNKLHIDKYERWSFVYLDSLEWLNFKV